jgi:sugar O-acyltransferase (sialic acid O-acetyltransferase NeuD family)
MKNKIILFGTGEIGEMAHFYFTNDSDYEVVAFSADDEYVESDSFLGLPLVPLSQLEKSYPVEQYNAHVAMSFGKMNQTRAAKYNQLKEKGYKLVSYVCSKAATWADLSIGDNCFILENQTIQPGVKIGNNVMIWSGNHIGHKTVIGDHTYLSSHVCICGFVNIGTHCFLGVNSTIRDFAKVGDSVFIAMDASIQNNIKSGSVVLGEAAKIHLEGTRVADLVLKKFFPK